MACFICGRGSCISSFHSLAEQEAFADAEIAYEKYLEVRQRCREKLEEEEEDDE